MDLRMLQGLAKTSLSRLGHFHTRFDKKQKQSSSIIINHAIGAHYTLFQSLHYISYSRTLHKRHKLVLTCQQRTEGTIRGKASESKAFMENLSQADATELVKSITPLLDSGRHKGQAGKIAVIGGCREYTGAPYFAAISALKIGADLSHVFCTREAAIVIKSYSPELIVHPVLEESYSIKVDEKESVRNKVLADVSKWIERFDCIVVGPGLGRDPFLLECVREIILLARRGNTPLVIDGDGLFLVTNNPELVAGYSLAILTPNVNEHKRLVQKVMEQDQSPLGDKNGMKDKDAPQQLQMLSMQMGGVTILQKGKTDLISDGNKVYGVSIFGSPRRCGGQGDILSGSVAVFSSWARYGAISDKNDMKFRFSSNPAILGAIAGSVLMRKAASVAFEQHKRSTLTTNIIEVLGKRSLFNSPDKSNFKNYITGHIYINEK
ncbi:ATP-dependent (S)-NAD(P)H-hydrate dehydratase isoform X4 [Cryptomeria japonica]|uniref:ATP-dependent (S)-NAD(P)H-hydrate dehydratase isoform X4 n=1 Tax=Cryptomeria japonica TaxID=3369 RepID=UPI0025ACE832|nr:ATP-dependent (S)-NAD(P)H-hydrate dehydratase isoform X4 [Cryptomeria japonica]